jgi:nucleoside-diphosphate-sugar epimerase
MALDDGRALPNFLVQAIRGEPLVVHGDGRQTRSFCFVSDTVAGVRAVLERGDDQPYNVGRRGEMTILDFARRIREITGSQSPLVHDEPWPDDPRRRDPDTRRLEGLGWAPRVPLEEGLRRTAAWFRERLGTRAER